MTVTVDDLQFMRSKCLIVVGPDVDMVADERETDEILALAIHGLNCQAAGITAERLAEGSVPHWPAELKARPAEEVWAATKARLLEPETDQERIARKVRQHTPSPPDPL